MPFKFLVFANILIGLWWIILPKRVVHFYARQSKLFGLGNIQIRPWLIRLAGVCWLLLPVLVLLE